jgi:hypothetical protein
MEPPFSAAMRKVRGELQAQGVMPGAQMLAFKNATRDAYAPISISKYRSCHSDKMITLEHMTHSDH